MRKEIEFWRFVASRLDVGQQVVLLIVAESHGSSPGRAGYKMAVAADGDLTGSIGGGVMEIDIVERARSLLSQPKTTATGEVIEQVHRKKSPNASGMICSGRQSVILKQLTRNDLGTVEAIIDSYTQNLGYLLILNSEVFSAGPNFCGSQRLEYGHRPISFSQDETDFSYSEELDRSEPLYIIGGGHCALALSELGAKLNFRISIFDDRPALNTIQKNQFADSVTIIDSYENIGEHIPNDPEAYVVVMTLGYASDSVVIRQLIDREFKYFGVLGSKAKMATLLKELRDEGFAADKLARIRTPIGLPINSQTPEEIAVSIAAEIIAVRNDAVPCV